jgi:hypothetical protein
LSLILGGFHKRENSFKDKISKEIIQTAVAISSSLLELFV